MRANMSIPLVKIPSVINHIANITKKVDFTIKWGHNGTAL